MNASFPVSLQPHGLYEKPTYTVFDRDNPWQYFSSAGTMFYASCVRSAGRPIPGVL